MNAVLLDHFAEQARFCDAFGSPLMARLIEAMATSRPADRPPRSSPACSLPWSPHRPPRNTACGGLRFFAYQEKRTALLHKLKDVFRHFRSQPVRRVIELINPILRGWVNYFAVGHSSRCFSYVRHWVDMMIRRQMMRAQKHQGFGWETWSRQRLYEELGLFNGYHVRSRTPKVSPA